MKATPAIAALNAGEWTPLLEGRIDLEGYRASCAALENVIPTVQGPAVRRPGTAFVNEVKDSADRTWLVPFRRSRAIAYVVEFGDQYCRFYFGRSAVLTGSPTSITGVSQASPAVVTTGGHSFTAGQRVFLSGISGMTELNGRWFTVANPTGTTFELQNAFGSDVDSQGYTAWTSGGAVDTPYEIASPYALADLTDDNGMFQLDIVQSADVLFITSRTKTYAPRKLTRTSSTSWAFSEIAPDTGPFLDANSTDTSIYASAASGTITLTASSSIFTADHVGALIRIDQEVVTATDPWIASTAATAGDFVRSEGKEYEAATTASTGTSIPAHTSGTVSDGGVDWTYRSAGYGIARITAQSGTTATATVLTRFPQTLVGSGNASTDWRFGAWSAADGYPAVVAFFKERLVFGKGDVFYMSRSASFEDFSLDTFGEVLKTDAITLPVQSDTTDEIVGLTPGSKVLTVHTEGGEHTVTALTANEAFGPGNVTVDPATTYGSRPIRPLRVGEAVLYVQASGRKLREQTFDFNVDSFVARDLLVRAEHLAKKSARLIGMVRSEEPYQMQWLWRSDGALLGFTYDRTQEVRAWTRHPIGGTDAKVESCAVIPSPDGDADDLWLVVSRTINGVTKRYTEYLTGAYETGDALADAVYMDSSITYDGAAATAFQGADHLEGETVRLLGDGSARPDTEITDGAWSVAESASKVQLGLATVMRIKTHRAEAGARDGTAQTKTKRTTDATLRVLETLGGSIGSDFETMDAVVDLTYRDPATPMDTGEALFTGDAAVGSLPGGYETDGRICYENDSQFPATVVMIVPQVVTNEAR